jgi:hypothetical protein
MGSNIQGLRDTVSQPPVLLPRGYSPHSSNPCSESSYPPNSLSKLMSSDLQMFPQETSVAFCESIEIDLER